MDESIEQIEAPRIEIPSKYRCDKHVYYSDEKPCDECRKENSATIQELARKVNLPIAALIDDNGVMQIIINTHDEKTLWATWKRIEKAIDFVLHQAELKRQATAIQTAPASVLGKLRGNSNG